MFFQPLSGPRPARNTVHLDLTVPWGSRVATVDRFLARGATHLWDVLKEYQHHHPVREPILSRVDD